MAVYHLSVKNGSPGFAAAHAAYIGREGQYADRDDLQVAESGNLPRWAEHDPSAFWSAADCFERVNGRPFRELEISLPRELNSAQQVELVREFVSNVLGELHAFTWAIHSPEASDGQDQPHVHLMFSERTRDGIERDPEHYFRRWNSKNPEFGGAGKDRYFSSQKFVWDVRSEWAETANAYLERAGIEARIDARSYRAQGLDLEPQLKKGITSYAESRGVLSEITLENRARAERNGERLAERPELAIAALTANQSVFSKRDLQQFVFRNTDGAAQFETVSLKVLQSPELVALARGNREGEWFTSRELFSIEKRLVETAKTLAGRVGDGIAEQTQAAVQAGRNFNEGQVQAFRLLTGSSQLATVNGAAGTGKSTVLAAVHEAYAQEGFKVIGAALQGKTADDLQRDTGIASSTLHRLIGQLDRGDVRLDARTVVVVDEAGLVGSRQMAPLLDHAAKSGAAVRLVGDAYQLHAVDAGDAFRAVSVQTAAAGASAGLSEILRQREVWQRAASGALSEHRIAEGLEAYRARGHVTEYANQDAARAGLLAQWEADRQANPALTQLLVTHTNRERQALNTAVRDLRREAGELGQDVPIQTATGRLAIAAGDRILFTRNDTGLAVKNGTLGVVKAVDGGRLAVKLDDGRALVVDPREYGHLDHGYALTVHKSQGVTVDRAYVLATPTLNAQLAYVALTRHREGLQLAYGREHFKDSGELAERLSRVGRKAFSADHALGKHDPENETGRRESLADRRGHQAPAASEKRPVAKSPADIERERIERISAKELRAEIDRIRPPSVQDRLNRNPAMIAAVAARQELQGKQSASSGEALRAHREAHQWQQDNPKRARLHELGAVRSAYLAEREQIKTECEQAAKALKEPLKAALEAEHRLQAQLSAAIKAADAPAHARVAALRPIQREKAEQEKMLAQLKSLAEKRAKGVPGFRDNDRKWLGHSESLRSLVDRYNHASDPARRTELLGDARSREALRGLQRDVDLGR
jgi:Ti-type conjugative transfer relaxase TraA